MSSQQAPGSTVGQPCSRLSAGNIRRIFGGILETLCFEWYTSVDSRRLSTVEFKSKAFLAVDSGAWLTAQEGAEFPDPNGLSQLATGGGGKLTGTNIAFSASF
eukprot:1190404-Prorocentrum_minimum.AAC.1